MNGDLLANSHQGLRWGTVDVASKRTWVVAEQGRLWGPEKRLPCSPGQAPLCPTVPLSFSSAPHTGPWGALPRLPSSPGAPRQGSLGHCPAAGSPAPSCSTCAFSSTFSSTVPAVSSQGPRVLPPLGLCTGCSIRNTLPPRAPVHQISASQGSVERPLAKSLRWLPEPIPHYDFP